MWSVGSYLLVFAAAPGSEPVVGAGGGQGGLEALGVLEVLEDLEDHAAKTHIKKGSAAATVLGSLTDFRWFSLRLNRSGLIHQSWNQDVDL